MTKICKSYFIGLTIYVLLHIQPLRIWRPHQYFMSLSKLQIACITKGLIVLCENRLSECFIGRTAT